jgi:hypothetical protein
MERRREAQLNVAATPLPRYARGVSPAIWRRSEEEWRPLLPSGFPSEEALHDLVEQTPNLLPLSGDPTLVVLGREVGIGPGYADLIAVDADGRLTVIEIKLRKNAEARRAVVAQILTYAAYLKSLAVEELEGLVRPYLGRTDSSSIADTVRRSDQSGEFDPQEFNDSLAECLGSGSFRLVLVLDEAPSELVQLVGYLESITSGVTVDLVTVSAFEAGREQILVPQRVDPGYQPEPAAIPTSRRSAATKREVDGSDAFEQAVERAPESRQPALRRMLDWARTLEAQQLATLRTVFGEGREILLVWVRGEKAGLVSVWNDNGAYLSLWRSVFVRLAWEHIERIEQLIGKPLGQGNYVADPPDELLAALTDAYRAASRGQPTWNGTDFYVSFGEGSRRNWDDARDFGFISAGGGEWYSKSLQQLKPGNRVFAYIPKGNGVGGYVGVGEVTAEAMPAKDFMVERNGHKVPYLEVANAVEAGNDRDVPELAEWVVPVRWIETRDRGGAIRDSDFFANQNSAVKLTHGYTLRKLQSAFSLTGQD